MYGLIGRILAVPGEHHQHSLALPAPQEAIRRGRPLIARFDNRAETVPLGGEGLTLGEGK
jgi:hypothetical protein